VTAATIDAGPRRAGSFSLPLALSIALKELRSGVGGLSVFVFCIALGVAAVAAIGSLAASFDEALARQGRLLIGGDFAFELIHRQATDDERARIGALGKVSESAGFRAMARAGDGKSALIEVKAVDDAYPLYGEVSVLRPPAAGTPWREKGVVLAEQTLLDRFGIDVGDTISIGEAKVRIGGVLGEQPDRLADRLAYGPKLNM
jgi:putative ABC transport system permease protein